MYIEPVVLVGNLQGSFLASFFLGWCVTVGASTAAYPVDTIRCVDRFQFPLVFSLIEAQGVE